MKRRFSDEQIIGMIKEYEAGVKAQELCRSWSVWQSIQWIDCSEQRDQRCHFL